MVQKGQLIHGVLPVVATHHCHLRAAVPLLVPASKKHGNTLDVRTMVENNLI